MTRFAISHDSQGLGKGPFERALQRMPHLPGFPAWNHGNALVRTDGLPLVWHHATDMSGFNAFTRWGEGSIGFHFGDMRTAETRLSQMTSGFESDGLEGCSIVPVVARALAPLRMPDAHLWEQDRVAAELRDLGVVDDDQADALAETPDAEALFAAIEAAGYDAIVYANETEAGGTSDSLLLWRAEQIKGIFANSFPLQDPRILPQEPLAAADRAAWSATAELIEEFRRHPPLAIGTAPSW